MFSWSAAILFDGGTVVSVNCVCVNAPRCVCLSLSQNEGEDNEAVESENASTKELDPNNPRDYIQKASATMDDEYSQKKGNMQNYYGIAHTLREPVHDQPTMVINGRLKEYQVMGRLY